MSETSEPDANPAKTRTTPRPLNAKSIRRRIEKIGTAGDDGSVKGKAKKLTKLSDQILTQIATGQISNPVAAARAYVEGKTAAPTEQTDI